MFGLKGAWWDRWRAGLRYLGQLVGCTSQSGELNCVPGYRGSAPTEVGVGGAGWLSESEGGACIHAWLCRAAEQGFLALWVQTGGSRDVWSSHPRRRVARELAGYVENGRRLSSPAVVRSCDFILHPRSLHFPGALSRPRERGTLPRPASLGWAA